MRTDEPRLQSIAQIADDQPKAQTGAALEVNLAELPNPDARVQMRFPEGLAELKQREQGVGPFGF